VLASVYAPGGRIVGVAPWRLAASKAVSNSFRYAGGLKDIHTLSSLYRVYRAGTLRRAAETYGWLLVREPGFAANVELLLKLYNAGATVSEVATVNDWSRRLGVSKMSLKPTVMAYGRLMAAHIVGRIQPPPLSPLGVEEPVAKSGPRRIEEAA
jgi:dolichol-phosphate mannosyltransferase